MGTNVAAKTRVRVVMAAVTLLATVLTGTPVTAQSGGPPYQRVRSCQSLAEVRFEDGSVVTGAVSQGTGMSAYCLVTVRVPERINVAVALPDLDWNGRHQANGGGVYEGVLFPVSPNDRGQEGRDVVSGTDTGHQSALLTGEWAWSPLGPNYSQINDFGFRAHHEATEKAKALIRFYYGRHEDWSYWNGCSSGGRAGLTQAMRYPEDHDAIVAGAPAINWTRFIPAEYHPAFVQTPAGGGHDLGACKRDAFTAAAVDYCAGTYDGMTARTDPRFCDFEDSQALQDMVGTDPCGDDPITQADIEVVKRIWEGPRGLEDDPDESFRWFGLSPNTPMGSLGTPGTQTPLSPQPVGGGFLVATEWLKWFVHKDPAWDVSMYSSYQEYIDDIDASVQEWDYALGTDNPDLSAFRDNGGKVLIYHGMADALIFWQGTEHYYQRVVDLQPGDTFEEKLANTRDFARLYLVPDAGHCAGTSGDLQEVVRDWRENGKAPDTLAGSGGINLCMWPDVPRHTGSGDPEDGSNYECVPPPA